MKAAVLREIKQPLTIEDVYLDAPGPDEVRIRVVSSGLCHSDYHSISGDFPVPMPAVLGHEAAGVVEAVGSDVTEFKKGDEVVTCVSQYCGHCRECLDGHNNVCGNKPTSRLDDGPARITRGSEVFTQYAGLGAFAEEMLIHRTGLTKIPEGMPLEKAGLLGCAVLTGVGAALNGAQVKPGSTVVVIGCGGVGLNAIQGAMLSGAGIIIAADILDNKLEMAKTFGATHTINTATDNDPAKKVKQIAGGLGVDYSFDAVSVDKTQALAFDALAPGGHAVAVGISAATVRAQYSPMMMVFGEKTMSGTFYGSVRPNLDFPILVDHYMEKRLNIDGLISRTYKLDEINDGFKRMMAGEVARGVVVFD